MTGRETTILLCHAVAAGCLLLLLASEVRDALRFVNELDAR